MAFPNVDELLKAINNRYELCIAAAKRARQLNLGARPLVHRKDMDKVTSIALEEIRSGKVRKVDKAAERGDMIRVLSKPVKKVLEVRR